jgi:hypothetical protein
VQIEKGVQSDAGEETETITNNAKHRAKSHQRKDGSEIAVYDSEKYARDDDRLTAR